MRETYNDLEWDIDEIPIGFSTPDDLFEYSYRATTKCPGCGNYISGVANIWSREEDGTGAWLHDVRYDPCENCGDENEDDPADEIFDDSDD